MNVNLLTWNGKARAGCGEQRCSLVQPLTVPLGAAQVIDVEVPNSVVLKVRPRRRALLLRLLTHPAFATARRWWTPPATTRATPLRAVRCGAWPAGAQVRA